MRHSAAICRKPPARIALWLLGAFACVASPAVATGINLSWDDCGTSGAEVEHFACDTNSGIPFTVIGSFIPPVGVDAYTGFSAIINLKFANLSVVPDWWAMGTGQCRQGGFATSSDFVSGPFTCVDVFTGQGAGGFDYAIGPTGPRIRIQYGLPVDRAEQLDVTTEYYAFALYLKRVKSTGAGACAGCSDGVCLLLSEIQLFQPPDRQNDPQISNPAYREHVTWQNQYACPVCACPASSRSWGQIKCMFR